MVLLLAVWSGAVAWAAGPRWVTGPPYFTTSGQPVVWYTTGPRYYTDPGDLSAAVDHASADALVAAAAAVWNVPSSSLTLTQGGSLAEHVSGANAYMGQGGPVFPADVSSANYAAIQIPVIYDADGSITDLLLGQGASDPDNCRQNGVTESVDSIIPAGKIQHALLILNGRCSGSAAEQQLQLRYQLERAFGRVLGLGWSQTNDNVFTGVPQATAADVANWPIMHPIDIVCGPYTYQCLTSPFSLRLDDVASISQLYFIAQGTAAAGKADTLGDADSIHGMMHFGSGQGMQGMNLLVRRKNPRSAYLEENAVVSTVTGTLFRWNNGNPVTGLAGAGGLVGSGGSSIGGSMGAVRSQLEGAFNLGMIPILAGIALQDAYITSEPINPLYTGEYGIGPYPGATVSPSGPAFPWNDNGVRPYESNYYVWSVPGSVATCLADGLGSETAPVAFAASGWWDDVLCGYGVSAWQTVEVRAGRNLTIEVTALNEQGLESETKLEPLIGVWQQTDATGELPTVAATASPFNSIAAGLTLLNFDTPAQAGTLPGELRLAITDERGDGRPDFAFRARVLYADSISPTVITADGGLVLISGMGFRPGNQVTISGSAAAVISSSTNTILALAPPFAALGPGTGLTVDVAVVDPATGGATIIYGGLSYPASALPSQTPQVLVLTPAFYIAAGQQVAFIPVVSLSDAGVASAGETVSWTSASSALSFAAGGQSVSGSNGLATIATMAGPLTGGTQAVGSACAFAGVCGGFTVFGVDPSRWVLTAVEGESQSVPLAGILQPVAIQVTDGAGHPVIGATVAVYQTVSEGVVCPVDGRCPVAAVYETSQAQAVSDGNGLVVVTALQLSDTPQVTTIAAAAGTQGFVSIPLEKHP